MLQDLSDIATVLTGGCALIALVYAHFQLQHNKLSQKEATAKTLFQNYLNAAVSQPIFAQPNLAKIKSDEALFKGYGCFIWLVLSACEEIYTLFPHDGYWTNALYKHLSLHKEFLSTNFESESYSKAFQKLVNHVVTGDRSILHNNWQ